MSLPPDEPPVTRPRVIADPPPLPTGQSADPHYDPGAVAPTAQSTWQPPPPPPPQQAYAQPYAQPYPQPYGQPYAQPGYGAYPQQAYGAPGYPAPGLAYPAYYGAPAYYAPAYGAAQEETAVASVAGVMYVLCLIRNLIEIVPAAIAGGLFFTSVWSGMGTAVVIFPILGLVGCALAMVSDFTKRYYGLGAVGGIIAVIFSGLWGFPFGFGYIGASLAVIGLLLHAAARKEFLKAAGGA